MNELHSPEEAQEVIQGLSDVMTMEQLIARVNANIETQTLVNAKVHELLTNMGLEIDALKADNSTLYKELEKCLKNSHSE
ncbi:MAG: hypothetical protein V6Z82_07040 [Flavobacteriales bacterium]